MHTHTHTHETNEYYDNTSKRNELGWQPAKCTQSGDWLTIVGHDLSEAEVAELVHERVEHGGGGRAVNLELASLGEVVLLNDILEDTCKKKKTKAGRHISKTQRLFDETRQKDTARKKAKQYVMSLPPPILTIHRNLLISSEE